MAKPVILAVDDEPVVLGAVERDLRRKYGKDYAIVRAESGQAGLDALQQLQARGQPVALFVVDQRMPNMTGVEFLEQAANLYPEAKRTLLTAYADTEAAIRAINDVHLDYYLMKPWDPPDQNLYPVLDDLLGDWRAGFEPPFEGIRIVGVRWSAQAHDTREFLARNQVPYRWVDVETDPQAAELLRAAGCDDTRLPVVLFPDGTALAQPDIAAIAEKVGRRTHATLPFYDLVIIGGGPAGLAAGVYGASEGLRTLLVEREAPGGQAGTSSRIENYLGFPVGLSGADLARRAVAQATRFGVEILAPQEVTGLRIADPYRIIHLGDDKEISCHALVLASGVSYRRLNVPGVERLTGAGVYYGAAQSEAPNYRDEEVYLVGGANSAGQAAMHFARYCRSVNMIVRGDALSRGMSQYLVDQIEANEKIHVLLNSHVAAVSGDQRLEFDHPRQRGDRRGDARARTGALHLHRRPAAHRLAGRSHRARRGGLHPDRARSAARRQAGRRVAPAPRALLAGDERARHLRGRRRAPSLGQAHGHGRGRGLHGRAVHPPVPVLAVARPQRSPMPDTCTHLDRIKDVTASGSGCEECLRTGSHWVHLRVCLTCGHVGCCDESPNRHARAHYAETRHPIMRSLEPGEDWMWCYVDGTVLYPAEGGGAPVRVATAKEFLRQLPLFAGLSEEDLDRLTSMAEPAAIPAGAVLLAEGSPGEALYVVLDGELEVSKHGSPTDVILGVRRKGEVIGEGSLLEGGPRSATVRALTDCRLLMISQSAFQKVLAWSPSAVSAILHTVTGRLRSTQTLLLQQEKMASLGALAAGLAHELNNPAAAVRRSADLLSTLLGEWQALAAQVDTLSFTPAQAARVQELRARMADRCGEETPLDPLARSDRESEVEAWLDEQGVPDAWERAPVLVGAGWQPADLAPLAGEFPPEQLRVVLPWLAAGCAAYGLLDEVKEGATRISDIVRAVKTYSYLDQAPVQEVDVHEGLDNTLVILRHKLKQGVTVHREYAPDLPRIDAYAGELNQVWTNLIDNAIDAMHGKGAITIRTYARPGPGEVVVEIEDNGPGIPPAVQPRIFEPFFTTKGPGAGTGLGLHIAYNIVVDKHRGRLTVELAAGQHLLPGDAARAPGAGGGIASPAHPTSPASAGAPMRTGTKPSPGR